MKNLSSSLKSWKTTVLGFVPIILSLLIMLGVITVEDQQTVNESVNQAFDSASGGLDNVMALISAVVGLIGVFSKDGDK
jgi:L-lactate permease